MAREISPFPEGVILTTPIVEANVLVQSIYAEATGAFITQKQIPLDNTIPQITEGAEYLTAVITPTNALNRIRVRFQTWGASNQAAANRGIAAALFRDAVANALAAVTIVTGLAGGTLILEFMALEFQEIAGSIALRTYSIRIGQDQAPDVGNSARLLADQAGVGLFGGVARSTLVVDELTP